MVHFGLCLKKKKSTVGVFRKNKKQRKHNPPHCHLVPIHWHVSNMSCLAYFPQKTTTTLVFFFYLFNKTVSQGNNFWVRAWDGIDPGRENVVPYPKEVWLCYFRHAMDWTTILQFCVENTNPLGIMTVTRQFPALLCVYLLLHNVKYSFDSKIVSDCWNQSIDILVGSADISLIIVNKILISL